VRREGGREGEREPLSVARAGAAYASPRLRHATTVPVTDRSAVGPASHAAAVPTLGRAYAHRVSVSERTLTEWRRCLVCSSASVGSVIERAREREGGRRRGGVGGVGSASYALARPHSARTQNLRRKPCTLRPATIPPAGRPPAAVPRPSLAWAYTRSSPLQVGYNSPISPMGYDAWAALNTI
jgi:hypothetical protein